MRKAYTSFLMLFVVALTAFNSTAGSIKLHIADPEAVSVQVNYSPYEIVAGENTVVYEDTGYGVTCYISAKDGYILESVVGADPSYGDIYVSSNTATLYLGADTDGREYTVNTKAFNRSATMTVKVKDEGQNEYTKVNVTRGTSSVTLESFEQTISFDPELESDFTFRGYPEFYSVKHNGTAVASEYGDFYVRGMKNGDVVEIVVNYPDVQVPVVFTVPEGLENVVSSVQVDYNDVTNYLADDFTVKAGSTLVIRMNTTDYKVNSVTINDVPQDNFNYINYKVGTDPVFVEIDAAFWGTLDFVLDVDDPARVNVYPGSYSTGNDVAYELVAGENPLSVNENLGYIRLKAVKGCYIESVCDGDGNGIDLDYNGAVQVTAGMTIVVRTGEINYDCSWVLYIDDLANVNTAYYSDEATREYVYITEPGYTVVPFASSSVCNYMLNISGSYGSPAIVAYKNGELLENPSASAYFYSTFMPSDGDVLKIYTNGAPETRNITFALAGNDASDFSVYTDIVREENAWADGLNVLDGTRVTVKATGTVDDMLVSLDGTALQPDIDGNYSFDVTADHAVEISGTVGVSDVVVENNAAPSAIYNLQGVKLSSEFNSLPAGIYIVNGKKVVKR